MNIKKRLEQLINHKNLSAPQMRELIHACMAGELSDSQIAACLALLRMKGETVEELSAAAMVLIELAHKINLGDGLIDIVGTGGDGINTFNISTISSFVAAAAGAKVAKHGARSVSSQSGSADLLDKAGFVIELTDEQSKICLEQCGITFLYAPHFHQAMQSVRNARKELRIRTLFNFLGPLINPARVKRSVIGVFSKHWLKPLAEVLASLGSERVFIINSRDGLDEVSITEPTEVVEYYQGEYKSWHIDPKKYGCYHPSIAKIIVNSPQQSLDLAEEVLSGKKGEAYDIVLLNSAAALFCADLAKDYQEAVEKAKFAIDSGEAARRFEQLKQMTQRLTKGNNE